MTRRPAALVLLLSASCPADPSGSEDTTPPTAPTGLTVSTSTPSDLQVSWVASTDDVGVAYYVVREDDVEVAQVTENVHREAGLPAGARKCFTVVAVDGAGNRSAPSEAACGATLWQSEVVVSGDAQYEAEKGTFPALAVDATDRWIVAYREYPLHGFASFSIAERVDGTWTYLGGVTGGSTSDYTFLDLAVAPDGASHLVLFHSGWKTADLGWYSPEDGTGVIAAGGSRGSIAVDDGGTLHVAFLDGLGGISYATNDGGTWAVSSVDMDASPEAEPSLALGPDGEVHVAYAGGTPDQELRHATNASGTWSSSVVDVPGGTLGTPAIGVTSDGAAHVVYGTLAPRAQRVATNLGGSWAVETLDTHGGTFADLAVGADDVLHAVWFDDVDQDLRYATDRYGAWWSTTLDRDGDTGDRPSIAVRPDGSVVAAYHARVDYSLVVTWTEGGGSP